MKTVSNDLHDSICEDFVMVESAESACSEAYLEAISQHVEFLSNDLREISLSIHDNPELQYKEFHAHKVLTEYLEKQEGWEVTPSAYNIPTAFVATFDSGKKGPVVSFNAEYDALVGIGHACGHNLIAMVSLGAALASAKVVEDKGLSGKIVLFGTPAEEGGGGKIKLLNAGAYAGVDVSLMGHPGIERNAALVKTAAYQAFNVEYFGKEAHAAARPWDGTNALDALITAYNSISVLRQQTQFGDIIQGMITNGGARPNIIHAYAAGRFVVRATSQTRLEELKKKVVACFEAGETATGARLKLTWKMSYDNHVPNHMLGRSYRNFFNSLGGEIRPEELDIISGRTQASTDQGNVSHAVPSLHTSIWIRSEDNNGNQLGGPHTPDFEKAARTEEAHELGKRAAKALAATVIEILTKEGLLAQVKEEFEKMKSEGHSNRIE